MLAKVGSFAKVTGGAPASQVVTGVGFTPKALILFTSKQATSNSLDADFHLAVGFSTASGSGSMAFGTQDGVPTSNTSQRAAAVALTIVTYGEALVAEATLTSLDSDGFTLSWTTNDSNAYLVGYVAFSDAVFSDANVVELTAPATAIAKSVTGMGFEPDLLFLIANMTTAALPNSIAHANLTFGFWGRDGAQASVGAHFGDAAGTATSFGAAAMNSICLSGVSSGVNAILKTADSDGATLHFLATVSGQRAFLLGLKGAIRTLGGARHAKPVDAAPVDETVDVRTDVPGLLVLGQTPMTWTSVRVGSIGGIGLGFSDGTTSACVAGAGAKGATNFDMRGIIRTDKLFVDVRGPAGGPVAIVAVADTPTLATPSAATTWSTNDVSAHNQVWLQVQEP